MSEGLREFDDSIGKCYHCNKLIFKKDDFIIPSHLLRSEHLAIAHPKCEGEYMLRASQI